MALAVASLAVDGTLELSPPTRNLLDAAVRALGGATRRGAVRRGGADPPPET